MTTILLLLVTVWLVELGFRIRRNRARLAHRLRLTTAPNTPLEYRNYQAALRESRPEITWEMCPVCRCPAVPVRGSRGACEVCDWEPETGEESPAAVAEARTKFEQYGSVYTPAECADWGGKPVPAHELACKREIVAATRKAAAGEMKLAEWLETVDHCSDSLRAWRLQVARSAE